MTFHTSDLAQLIEELRDVETEHRRDCDFCMDDMGCEVAGAIDVAVREIERLMSEFNKEESDAP